ncbi:hypothetical protein FRC03_010651 [Tulasnella sp. 419]|nr:hypothetical protein FRC03_010651 [Tulasnella sp. 419]
MADLTVLYSPFKLVQNVYSNVTQSLTTNGDSLDTSTRVRITSAHPKIANLEAAFCDQPWMTPAPRRNLEQIRTTVMAFEIALKAETAGHPIQIDKSILPYGPDYIWLQEIFSLMDSMVEEVRMRYESTSAHQRRIVLATNTKFDDPGLFKLGHDDLIHKVTLASGKRIKI